MWRAQRQFELGDAVGSGTGRATGVGTRLTDLFQLAERSGVVHALTGPLDRAEMWAALDATLRSHAALRIYWGSDACQSGPLVAAHALVRLPLDDLTHLPEAARAAAAQDWQYAQSARQIDPTQVPLLRVSVARLAPNAHRVAIVAHKLLGGAEAVRLIEREWGARFGLVGDAHVAA